MRIAVSPSVLPWAMERSGGGTDLSRKFPRLSEWLTGTAQPTLRQLEEFAKAASIPFGYLLLPEPPEERLPIPHFRSRVDKPTRQEDGHLEIEVAGMEQKPGFKEATDD